MASETSDSARETEEIGARLARALGPGDVVVVSGELGSGKTTLVRGALRALGVTQPVVSPTFTIGRLYRGGAQPVAHLDLYRLAGLAPEEPGILDDYLRPDAIAFIEWPERAGGLDLGDGVRVAASVSIRHAGGDRRAFEILGPGQ